MRISVCIFGYEGLKKARNVRAHSRIGILLYDERSRGVTAPNGQQTGLDILLCDPCQDWFGDRGQSFTASFDRKPVY